MPLWSRGLFLTSLPFYPTSTLLFLAHRDPSEKEKPAVQRVVFDDTGQFEKDRLVEITMKGNFAKKDQIKGFNLKKGTVLVMYGVTVKESKYGRMKLVLKETGVCPQGYAVVKP